MEHLTHDNILTIAFSHYLYRPTDIYSLTIAYDYFFARFVHFARIVSITAAVIYSAISIV